MLGLRRENVQNAAAHGELTRALDLCTALVARAGERLGQLIQRRSFSDGKADDGVRERLGRHGALGRRLYGGHRELRFAQLVQRRQTALLVAARYTDYIRHHQLARGQLHDLALGKAAQIGGKAVCAVVIVGQNQHRTAGVQSQGCGKVRLVYRRQTHGQHGRFALGQRLLQPFVFI